MDNENPTIIEVADLPTRKRERRSKNKGPRKAEDVTGANLNLPWGHLLEDEADADASGDDSGDPIDEQEIFGTHLGS